MHKIFEPTNANRAQLALDALERFIQSTGVDSARDAIADLVTNLMHLAKARDIGTEKLCHDALGMFKTETECDDEGDMQSVQDRFRQILPED
jgi:hypothetical protein